MSKVIQRQEYVINTPKTISESIIITKQVMSIMLSEIILDRKVFRNSKFVERTILGVPVKIMKCENEPELQFSYCLKIATAELKTQNLQSLKIIIASKEDDHAIEEYCIRFKYNQEKNIEIDMSQENDPVLNCSTENMTKMRKCIAEMLRNEKRFVKTVDPLPEGIVIKMQLSYYKETPIYKSKYFIPKPIPNDDLKNSCVKAKFGKIEGTFGTPLFTARSLLITQDTTDEERMMFD